MEQLKKWIEVEGKMMDAVEFTRFIRRQMADEIDRMVEEVVSKEHENTRKLRQLQQLA